MYGRNKQNDVSFSALMCLISLNYIYTILHFIGHYIVTKQLNGELYRNDGIHIGFTTEHTSGYIWIL